MEDMATESRERWLAAVAVSSFFCVAFVLVTDYLFWQFLVRKIDDRLEKLQDLLDRHSRECPVKKEQLLAGCLAVEETEKKGDAFRRTFTAHLSRFPAPPARAGPGHHAVGRTALHADQDEPEQPGNRRPHVHLARQPPHHALPLQAEVAVAGGRHDGRLDTTDRIR